MEQPLGITLLFKELTFCPFLAPSKKGYHNKKFLMEFNMKFKLVLHMEQSQTGAQVGGGCNWEQPCGEAPGGSGG